MGLLDFIFGSKKNPETKKTISQPANYSIESLIRVINDSARIIDKTKNIDTAISRFDLIKENLSKIFQSLPSGQKVELQIAGQTIEGSKDLYKIDNLKSKWLEENAQNDKRKIIYNQALTQWVSTFNQAIEDDIITEEELIELENLQESLGLSEKDTSVYWANCKAKMPPQPTEKNTSVKNELISVDQNKWSLVLQLAQSKSDSFKTVINKIKGLSSFKIINNENEKESYEVTFSYNDLLLFNDIWTKIKNWKSTTVKINNIIIEKKYLSKMLVCYRDRLKFKESNPLFCYGASPFTFNIFGCHRTMLRDGIIASQKCWFHIGEFDNNDIFHVDKEEIFSILMKNVSPYTICPALNSDNIKKGMELIPNTINPKVESDWTINIDYNGNKYLMPTALYSKEALQTFTESVGDTNFTFTASAEMLDYSASISPQFNTILSDLFKR